MSSVAKKVAKVAKVAKTSKSQKQKEQQSDVEALKPKKQSLKKTKKTAEIVAAKKLAKLNSKKAVSDKLNRAPAVKKQKAKHQFDPTRLNRGVVLIQNLPKGFFEKQLKKYFSQYGVVTRLRLARSERTGGSKGYAYIEFKYPEVAQVAAESINGYLMFRQRLKTLYIPPAKQDHDYFKQPVKFVKTKFGKTRLITPKTIRAAETVRNYNKRVTPKVHAERLERSKYKLNFLQKKLAKAGINIDLSSQLYTSAAPESNGDEATNSKNKKATNKEQKKRKTDSKETPLQKEQEAPPKKKTVVQTTVATPKSQKIRTNYVMAPTPIAKETDEATTPKPKKVRKNFVLAPTPEPLPKKKKNKNKHVSEVDQAIPVKSKKSKKNAPSTDVKLKKVASTSKVTKSKATKSTAITTKSLKKALNKKK